MSDHPDPTPRPPVGAQHALPDLSPMQATWRGTITALVVVFPVAVLNNIAAGDGEGSPLSLLFFALTMLGGAAGGWAVLRLSSTARLPHAAAAGAGAYLIAQAVGVVLQLARGDSPSWLAYPFLALLMACCGVLGGMFAARWQQQNRPGERHDGGG